MNKKALGILTEVFLIIVATTVLIGLFVWAGMLIFTPVKGFASLGFVIGAYLAIKNKDNKDNTKLLIGLGVMAASVAVYLMVK